MEDNVVPRYVINFDEFINAFDKDLRGLIQTAIVTSLDNHPFETVDMITLLHTISSILPDNQYKVIVDKINAFIGGKYRGVVKIDGGLLYVPAIKGDYSKDFIFANKVYLTGLHINQTGWKKEDKYSLIINNEKIVDNATAKEIGEHKYFNVAYEVDSNTTISFALHNLSGNSRQCVIDLEYIE